VRLKAWSSYLNRALPIALLLAGGPAAFGQDRNLSTLHVFPSVVDGSQADGTSYRTTLVMQNSNGFGASCWVGFQGSAPRMTAPDGTVAAGGLFQQNLPAGSFNSLRSAGIGSLTVGYVWISCSLPISAYAVYSVYDRNSNGIATLRSETTVYSTASATSMQFIADAREDGRLAISLANDEPVPVTVRIQAFDIYGRPVGLAQVVVPGKTNLARFVNELMPTLPAKHIGPIWVDSSHWIYATGFRFTGLVFTAVPPALSGAIR
jgi:hypothetical protein